MSEHACSKRVYSGERWDFGGHPCSRKGTVERDGRWWCKQHDPEAMKAREAKRDAAYRAEQEVKEATIRSAQALIDRLGAGRPHYSSVTGKPTGGVTLTAEEAASLADRLDSLRENA